MEITAELVKKLREQTGAPVMECRNALVETKGDMVKATEILRQKGVERAEKKKDRETKSGYIECYTHGEGKIGVLVELTCETDFVAKNDEFKKLIHEIALQIASMNPKNVDELLKQEYIRDNSKTIESMVKELIGKIGENMAIRRFIRYELGD